MFQSPPVHQVIPKDVDSPFINALLVCERLQTRNRIYNENDSDDATRLCELNYTTDPNDCVYLNYLSITIHLAHLYIDIYILYVSIRVFIYTTNN